MSCADVSVNPWLVSNWCKPFGVDSDAREWAITTLGAPERKARLKRFADDAERVKWNRARKLRDRRFDVSGKPVRVQPTLKVRAYAHDRIVLTAFDKLPPQFSKAPARGASCREIIRGGAPLVKRHESRRGFRIGNRWRFRPVGSRFTVHGRNMIMDAAHIQEHEGVGKPYFVTLTMAGGTRMAYAAMAAGAGYIMDRLNRWLRYRVEDGCYCYVWELQERGAPHLHFVFRLPPGESRAVFACHLKTQWRKILGDVSDESGVDLFARSDGGTWRGNVKYPRIRVDEIKHSYASYISKYASKNKSKGGSLSAFKPARWWGVSAPLRKKVRARRLEVYLPLPDLGTGVELAEGLIAAGAPICNAFKWLELPKQIVLHSVSVCSSAGLAKIVVQSLIRFVQGGDVLAYVRALKSLALSWRPADYKEIWDG